MFVGVSTALTAVRRVFHPFVREGLKLYYRFTGTFDETTPDFLLDGSTSFDGSNDYIACGSDSSLDNIFAGGGTVSAWVYLDGYGEANTGRIISKSNGNASGWNLLVTSSNSVVQFMSDWSTTDLNITGSTVSNVVALNQWHHIAVTYNSTASAGTSPIIYLDGSAIVLTGTASAGTVVDDSSSNLEIGHRAGTDDREFDGKIANVGIWNRALSASEIESIQWRGSHSELKDTELTNLVSWYDLDSEELGSEFVNHTGGWTAYGNNTIESAGGLDLNFTYVDNGSGVYSKFNNSSSYYLTVGAKYEISFDAYYTGGSAPIVRIYGSGYTTIGTLTTSSTRYTYIHTAVHDTNDLIQFKTNSSNVVSLRNYSVKPYNANDSQGSNEGLIVGATVNSDSYSGESPFKPRIQDKAAPKMAVQLADGSTSFDGTNDYIKISDNSDFDFGTGDFTIAFWAKVDDDSANASFIARNNTSTTHSTWFFRIENNSTITFANAPTENQNQYSFAVGTSEWKHYTASRIGTTTTIYANGSSVGSFSDSNNYSTNGGDILIGARTYNNSVTQYYDGSIANVAIYKGTGLTQTQIQELMFTEKYSGLSSDLKTNLVSWYDLGERTLGSEQINNTDFADLTGWTFHRCSSSVSGGELTITKNATGGDQNVYRTDVSIGSGKTAIFSVWVKNGSSGNTDFIVRVFNNDSAWTQQGSDLSGTSSSSWVKYETEIYASGGIGVWYFRRNDSGDGDIMIKEPTLKEVTLDDSQGSNDGSPVGATTTTGYTSSPHGVVDPLNFGEMYSGRALDFDGTNDYVDISSVVNDISSNTQGTICWSGTVDDFTSNSKKIWSFSDTDASEYLFFGVSSTDYKFYSYCVDGGSVDWAFTSSNTFKESAYLNVVLVHNGTTPSLYVNGVSESISFDTSTDKTTWFSDLSGIDNGRIGCISQNSAGNADFSEIKVNNFKVFNTALTQAQVQELYRNPEQILPTGASASNLKLDLPMQEGSGSYIYDGSGNQNHGTISGATWATGQEYGYQSSLVRSNTPMVFDGSDDYVQIMSNGKGTFSNQSFTISAWIKPNAVSSDKVIFSYDHTSHTDPHYAMHLRTMSSGRVTLDYNNGSGSGASTTSGNSAITAGVWQHICATYTSGTQKVYVNGSVVASGTDAYTITFYDQEVWIGKANFGGSEFDGLINEVAVWDVALDADAVTQLYGSGVPLLPTSDSGNYDNSGDLQGYWRNDGIATWTDRTPLGVYGSEFLTNGDFSSFSSGQATSWTTTGSPTLSEETTIVQSGSSQKIFMGSSGNNGIDQTVTTVAGKKYQFSAKVYVTGGRARIIFDNGSDDGQTYVGTGGSTGYEALNTWHTITHIKTAESTSVTARIWTSSANTTVYVDDVSIKRYRGGNDGTASGSPVSIVIPEGSTSGRDNQGFLLSDTTSISNGMRFYKNEYINVGDSEVLSFGDNIDDKPFSIEAWIYMNDSSVGNFCIVSKMTTQDDNGEYFFLVNSDEKLYLLLNEDDEASGEYGATPSLASYNKQWIHCVGTYDGRGGASACDGINIYINGSAQSLTRSGFGSYTAMNNTSADFIIGKRTGLAGQEADGMIDEVRIYQKELSASEVTKNYNSGKSSHS